jgi:hypothetical protein
MFVGWAYALGVHSKIASEHAIGGELYSADLTGAALGTLMPAIFFLPLIGTGNTFILLSVINLATGLVIVARSLIAKGDG